MQDILTDLLGKSDWGVCGLIKDDWKEVDKELDPLLIISFILFLIASYPLIIVSISKSVALVENHEA